MKLRTKILLISLAAAVLPVTLFMGLSFQHTSKRITLEFQDQLTRISNIKESSIARWLSQNEKHLESLAQRPQVREYVQQLIFSSEEDPAFVIAKSNLIHSHLIPNLDTQSGFEDFSIIRASDGKVLASTDKNIENDYRKTRQFFIEGLKGTFVDAVQYEISSERVVMHISTPISGQNGTVIAVLAGHLNLDDLSSIIALGTENSSNETYLVNTDNFFVTESRFYPGAVLTRTVYSAGVERCLEGETVFGEFNDYRDVPVLGYYKWIPERQVCLVTEIDRSEAYQPIDNLWAFYYQVGAVSILAVMGIALLFSRSVIKPIRALENSALAIASGDLDVSIKNLKDDEVGAVSSAFNQMARSLKQSHEQISHTGELLATLQRAAQTMQLAATHSQVFETAGREIGKLGFDVSIFTLDGAQKKLEIAYLSFNPNAISKVEKILGISRKNYRIPIRKDSIYKKVLDSGKPFLIENFNQIARDSLPSKGFRFIGKMLELIKIGRGIMSALKSADRVYGVLVVSGKNINDSDVSAVSTFANQMSNALHNIDLYQDINRSADELEDRVRERTRELEHAQTASLNMMEDLQQENEGRKAAEKELRRERNKAQQYLDIAGTIFVVLNVEGEITLINRKGCQVLGYKEGELIGKNWFDACLLADNIEAVKQVFHQNMAGNGSIVEYFENQVRTKSGKLRTIAWHNSVLRQGKRIIGSLSSGEDITERKLAETRIKALLKISSQVTHQLYDQDPLQVALKEIRKTIPSADSASILFYNPDKQVFEIEAWIGLSDETVRGLAIPKDKGIIGAVCKNKKAAIRNNVPEDQDFIPNSKTEQVEIKSMIVAPLLFQNDTIGAICVDNMHHTNAFTGEDLSLLESTANQLSGIIANARLFEQVQASREELRVLSKRLVEVHEEERKLVAMDLHDYFGQVLTSLKLSMRPESFVKKNARQQIALIKEANLLIDEIMDSAEDLSLRLRPTIIDDLGITPAFEWHINRYQKQTGLNVSAEISLAHGKRFPPEIEIALYRVMEEGLTNAARYAKAKEIKVIVYEAQGHIHLTIRDNGAGFDADQIEDKPGQHTGITGIKERVRLLSGSINIQSEAGSGTTIHVSLPIPEPGAVLGENAV